MQLKKLLVLILVLLAWCGKQNTAGAGMNRTSQQEGQEKHHQESRQRQRLRESTDVFFTSKRRVPNASDPLHNR
ncbi:hypothetical protein RHMOL_Rhmol07G0287000 [Rhododendron molle]|uniref:Uncharacterized protein n=1 Tax=Rhododendron molle TaxID=49168 RepID=A0ACC0N5S2_RHOML|nr:hypothetical protein RHMOL_Rhmol07G0287000 [Rhododendron molle]